MWDQLLLTATSATNFICLVISLWLGFYIVTRSPRSQVSWLASATVWALCGYFLDTLTFTYKPPGTGALPWWWGWSVTLAAPFWFHLSVSLLPGEAAKKRLLVAFVYLLALNFIAMEAYTPWVFSGATILPPTLSSAERPGPLYPLLGLYLIVIPTLALLNLRQSWQQAKSPLLRQQMAVLMGATGLAIFSVALRVLSTWLGLHTPTLLSSLSLSLGLGLLGYGVAQYNALVEGRVIRRDFLYTALAFVLVIGAYLGVAWVSDLVFDVPFIAFIFLIMLAIVSHALYDWARTYLDRLFYQQRHRELRANLRDFARTITAERDVQAQLQAILQTLCQSLQVSAGLIALREATAFVVQASCPADLGERSIAPDTLTTAEITVLSSSLPGLGLGDRALIVPLHAGGEQIGALALGPRASGVAYGEEELDFLEDGADTIASLVRTARAQEQTTQQIDTLLRELRQREQEAQARLQETLASPARVPVLEGRGEDDCIALVEDVLRHLHDYPYLGEHALARLRIVELRLAAGKGDFVTYLDRGQALHDVLLSAIDKLKPRGAPPSPLTREWHQYIILHDCYLLGNSNRDVMAALFIGEGTFNRARRRAIRGVTRALGEMEDEAQQYELL